MEEIIKELNEDISKVETLQNLLELKTKYLGKKGLITIEASKIKDIPNEEKKTFGMKMNDIKNQANDILNGKEEEINKQLLAEKLGRETIDVTLPETTIKIGAPNILESIVEQIEETVISLGFDVLDGPEIEEDKYNFELLNIPKGHPARDAQDTFYLKADEILLRSQTSPVQARTMLKGEGKVPIRMICPGKTYRRDNDDATHSHQFTQIEGLVVDHNASLADLKGTIDIIMKKMFGPDVETRFRPSYYQFTEPSVEIDVSCFSCHGKGCALCKNTGWITVCGAGIVHPNVLKMCGYDPKKWTGYAFGFGAERLAMIKYGIDDIRVFYQTDIRELKNFERRDNND